MSNWQEKYDAAHKMVSALCRPRGSEGSREWMMSIPARPERDPDLVIGDGLRAVRREVERLRGFEPCLGERLEGVLCENPRNMHDAKGEMYRSMEWDWHEFVGGAFDDEPDERGEK